MIEKLYNRAKKMIVKKIEKRVVEILEYMIEKKTEEMIEKIVERPRDIYGNKSNKEVSEILVRRLEEEIEGAYKGYEEL